MGYVTGYGQCIGCRTFFSFNPVRVPSVMIDGEKEPICLKCVEDANPRRIANGLVPIVPMPGAYEACAESDLE